MPRTISVLVTSAAVAAVLALHGSSASGQPGAAPAEMPSAPYASPQRDACQAELDKDPAWRADVRREFENAFHDHEARRVATNNRHVVLAYGALWVLMTGFLALMFARQRRLVGEIARLERDLAKAKAS